MEYTKPALLLMKKYAAKCRINWDNLSATVFQSHVERRAKSLGLKKINVDIVRWYWLKVHNSKLAKLLASGRISKQEADYCMTSVRGGKVFHRGTFIEKARGA